MAKVYIIGSLKNKAIIEVGNALRQIGLYAFDDWYSDGYEADDKWQEYEKTRGRTFSAAIWGEHAKNVFDFDKSHLDSADAAVLVLPAGRSGHLEAGYVVGSGKPLFLYFSQGEPDRFDIMYRFASGIFFELPPLVEALKRRFPS